ncbi:hypothetical protein ACV3RL_06960 [Clostridium perfringens]
MTNKDKKSKEKQFENEQSKEEKKKSWNLANIISVLSLIVTSFLTCFTINYLDKEYKYKLSPEVTVMARLAVEPSRSGDNVDYQLYAKELEIKILNKNNLEKAYLIYPNNIVKKLNINEIENILEEDLNKSIELKDYDFEAGGKCYQYRFLFLMGMDGSYELYLIYTKGEGKELLFNGVSEIEVWGFENSNKDNPEFEGERIMAEQYRKILKESSNYIK